MDRIFTDVQVGRKNVALGIALFLLLGVVVGIPLTVDFFGGSLLTGTQYQTWKVIHAYGVFLAFVNFFFGRCIDRLNLTRRQKGISSWSFAMAGLAGGIGRPVLFLLSILDGYGIYISLIETVGFVLGTFVFLRARAKERPVQQVELHSPPVSDLL